METNPPPPFRSTSFVFRPRPLTFSTPLCNACVVQVMAMGAGLDNLTIVDEDVAARARAAADGFNPEGIGRREFEAMVRRMSKALGTDWKQ